MYFDRILFGVRMMTAMNRQAAITTTTFKTASKACKLINPTAIAIANIPATSVYSNGRIVRVGDGFFERIDRRLKRRITMAAKY